MKKELGIFLILIISFSTFILFSLPYTGFVTVELPKSLEINLDKNQYKANELLSGKIKIGFNKPIDANTKVILSLDNQKQEKSLKKLLDETGIQSNIIQSVALAQNPVSTKKLIFTELGDQLIYLKLPKNSVVSSVDMRVSGGGFENGFPKNPGMDVGSDSKKEWLFFGEFKDFSSQLISNVNFDSEPQSSVILNDRGTLNCEIMNLSYAKHFKIQSKYSLFDKNNTNGDIKAVILSMSGTGSSFNAVGGADSCDLPEPDLTTFDVGECEIKMNNPIQGEFLVCVFNGNKGTSDKNFYRVGSESVNPDKVVVCEPPNPVTGITKCNKVNAGGDIYIAVNPGVYSDELKTSADLNDGFTEFSFVNSINNYIKNCITEECVIPVVATSNSKGTLTLSNLRMVYKLSGITREENNFYDISSGQPFFDSISNVSLTAENANITVSIPLSKFEGIKTPVSTTSKDLKLKASMSPGPSKETTIRVESVIETRKTGDIIEDSVKELELINEQELTGIIGIKDKVDEALSELNKIKLQIEDVSKSNLSENQKSLEINKLYTNATNIRSKTVKSVVPKEMVEDVIFPEKEDVTEEIVFENQKDENSLEGIYHVQKAVKVNVIATLYEVVDEKGKLWHYTLVKKQLSGRVNDGYVVEIIPKTIVNNLNEVMFANEDFEIVEEDPIVRFRFRSLSDVGITYVIKENILPVLDLTRTVVVPKEIPFEVKIPIKCGDNICSALSIDGETIPIEDKFTCPEDCKAKTPYTWLIVLLIVCVLGILYILYFKGKKPLFNSKSDEVNLIEYIKKSLQAGAKKEKIISILLSRGWNQKQIDYAFRKVENKPAAEKPKKEAEKSKMPKISFKLFGKK